MLDKPKKIKNDYEDSNPKNDYFSYINSKLYSKNYINIKNNPHNYINNIDKELNDNIYNNIYPYPFHYSQDKNNFPNNRNIYTYIEKYNTNTNINNKKRFSFLDQNLSNLTVNKYKRMRQENNFQTVQDNINSYRNDYLIHYTNSFNDFIEKNRINNEINKACLINNNGNDNDNIDNIENIENYHIDYNKKNKIKRLKNKIRLQKEISNFNNLEKKINKKIEKSNKQNKLKEYKKDYYNTHNYIINFNNDEIKNKKKDESLLNNIQISQRNSHDKLKRKKGDEDDIKSQKVILKRNTKFPYNDKENEENINKSFIKYLRNDNNKLIHINTIYKQLIDSFFYFVNQLAKKYDYKKSIEDINYYISNANDLSNRLIDLEQHLNNVIKLNDLNNNNINNNINTTLSYKYLEKENKTNNDKELLTKSKFITIDTDKIKKLKNAFITRNLYSHGNLTKNYKSNFTSKNNINKTLQNITPNYLNETNNNNGNMTAKNKPSQKVIKIRKNNGRLIKIMNKLNAGLFSPNEKSYKAQINMIKNKMINNNDSNLKSNKSNDLKSIINPKYLKESSFKYIN